MQVPSKIEVPRDVRNSKGPQTWQVQERMVSTLEQMQVPNGTGPGVRRSKRPLLASRTRCNVLWKPPTFGNKVKIGNKVQFGNKFANWCNVWSIECVIVYGHVPECHVSFRRGRLHNVWWDPNIDFLRDDFKRSMTYPCPRSLDESRAALRIKHS